MRIINRIISFLIVFLLVFTSAETIIVDAASRDYIIDDGERIPIPETYVLKDIIYSIGNQREEIKYFVSPEDIFINEQGYLFIADTGNNRIVKTTKDGEMVAAFQEADSKTFNSPMGVFVDENENIFIADTGNQRIVHLSEKGEFIEEFIKPDSELLGEMYTFQPTKLCVSPVGYIYMLGGEKVITIDAYNNFRGYVGQTDIGFRLLDVLLRIFASERQKLAIRKRKAAPYINMTLDENGMIYAVTKDYTTGEIKKLNSVGDNIYRNYTTVQQDLKLLSFDFLTTMQLESKGFVFGERIDDEGKYFLPLFKDIAIDKHGIVTVLEENTGKIYQYDQEGNLLTVFGGKGNQRGNFSMPVAVDVDDEGMIYVLDRIHGSDRVYGIIQVFEPTEFILMVHEAVKLYEDGEYDHAYNLWKEVLEIHENYPLARQGLAKALFKQKRWKEAMYEYKQVDDRVGYSEAFSKYRYEVFRNKFPFVLFLSIIITTIFIRLLAFMKKIASEGLEEFYTSSKNKLKIIDHFKLSFGIIFHPIQTCELIKENRDRMSIIPGVIILGVLLLVRIFYIFTVHFPFADIDVRDANIILETVKLLLPVITWVVASFAITSIMEGESKAKDIFIASSFCMLPYIIVNFPLAILSNILSYSESTLYAVILNITRIWIFILFFIQAKILNDYKFGKTTSVYVISGLSMILVWIVGIMVYISAGRLYQFIAGIISEFRMLTI